MEECRGQEYTQLEYHHHTEDRPNPRAGPVLLQAGAGAMSLD